ncbi:MAG: 3'-5' exonuclease domain-containing protein 2 [Zoogloeaceae bacterium]|nr:3'-5' exonuclease domain-containing protein 2 [Zoogloeaceae bacterium]
MVEQATAGEARAAQVELPVYRGISIADVIWVNSESLAQAAAEDLMAADALGFDTESKPTFKKGEESTGPHLVQLATDSKAYLFPVSCALNLDVIKGVLESKSVLKIGMGLGNDRSALKSRLGIELANVLDLGETLRGSWHKGTVGAKIAVARFFGQKFLKSKRTGTSNWAAPCLSERQKLYAANDAHVALKIYRAQLLEAASTGTIVDGQVPVL